MYSKKQRHSTGATCNLLIESSHLLSVRVHILLGACRIVCCEHPLQLCVPKDLCPQPNHRILTNFLAKQRHLHNTIPPEVDLLASFLHKLEICPWQSRLTPSAPRVVAQMMCPHQLPESSLNLTGEKSWKNNENLLGMLSGLYYSSLKFISCD